MCDWGTPEMDAEIEQLLERKNKLVDLVSEYGEQMMAAEESGVICGQQFTNLTYTFEELRKKVLFYEWNVLQADSKQEATKQGVDAPDAEVLMAMVHTTYPPHIAQIMAEVLIEEVTKAEVLQALQQQEADESQRGPGWN